MPYSLLLHCILVLSSPLLHPCIIFPSPLLPSPPLPSPPLPFLPSIHRLWFVVVTSGGGRGRRWWWSTSMGESHKLSFPFLMTYHFPRWRSTRSEVSLPQVYHITGPVWGCTVSAAPPVPVSALPIGMEREDGSTQLVPVEPSKWTLPPFLFCTLKKKGSNVWPYLILL